MFMLRRWLALCLLACTTCLMGLPARAESYRFDIQGLSSLGPTAWLALDFIDGDGPSNQVTVGGFVTDGALSTHSLTAGVSGSTTGSMVFADSSFFNEALLQLDHANAMRFEFSASMAPPAPGSFADAFSVFLLDPATGLPLMQTTDPTGANALMLFVVDGSSGGYWEIYSPLSTPGLSWQLSTLGAGVVPEPGSLLLMLGGLLLVFAAARQRASGPAMADHCEGSADASRLSPSWRARAKARVTRLCSLRTTGLMRDGSAMGLLAVPGLSVLLATLTPAPAHAMDLTAQVKLSRSGFVLNRSTNTFDTTVVIVNTSPSTLLGPLHLVLESATPAQVALYNSHGKTEEGSDYVVVPLASGALAPGASTTAILKLINTGQAVTQATLSLQGDTVTAAEAVTLHVQAFMATGPSGTAAGSPVGAGWVVRVDGVARGVTDGTGGLSVMASPNATTVSVERPPSAGGSASLAALPAGGARSVQVLVEDGKEVYGEGLLRFEQVQQLLLPRGSSRVSLRFLKDEQPLRLTSLNWVSVADITGNLFDLSALFTVQADGSVAAAPAAFFQALAGKAGKLTVNVNGNMADGQVFDGSAVFYIADYRVRVQLQAPPSQPGLPTANVRVSGQVLNTDIRFQAQSDANGFVTLPDLPGGNLSLNGSTTAGGVVYAGVGTAAITGNTLVRLTLRGPQDVLNNVPPIVVGPLPGGSGQSATAALTVPAMAPRASASEHRARAELQAQLAAKKADSPLAGLAATAAGPTSVTVSATASAENQTVQSTAQLTIKKGLKRATLKFTVSTAEYPYYVLQQSIYNDVWSISVLGANGASLFDITRQINSQLSQEPVWRSNGSTGEIKREIDVSALTATADATLILRATAVNIGDDLLATTAVATLEGTEPLIINKITPSPMPAGTANDGSYYSIPRSGATNTLARQFTLDITKPSGSTLTGLSLELRDGAGGALMTVVQEAAPGSADIAVLNQTDTSAKLRVRGTISNPASSIAGTPPPTRDLTYHFVVKGRDSQGTELKDEKDASGKRSLWRMPDGLGRYGGRDAGGDDWAARGTYTWLSANAALLREINDVSGEHGRNLQHQTHARGTDIDMFHFYLFPGVTTAVGGGAANHTALLNSVVQAFQTVGTQNPPPAATAALAQVTAWLQATRAGLTAIAARPEVSQVIHCRGTPGGGLAAGWCNTLLRSGALTRTVTGANGMPVTQTLTVGGAYTNNKMQNNDVHNDHIHITLNPGQINE